MSGSKEKLDRLINQKNPSSTRSDRAIRETNWTNLSAISSLKPARPTMPRPFQAYYLKCPRKRAWTDRIGIPFCGWRFNQDRVTSLV